MISSKGFKILYITFDFFALNFHALVLFLYNTTDSNTHVYIIPNFTYFAYIHVICVGIIPICKIKFSNIHFLCFYSITDVLSSLF